jgi:hypothetical protein
MPARFPILRDDEFYVVMKSSVPSPYRIEAEPSPAYYSEWNFCYKLYHGEKLVRTFEGDFRKISAGSLIAEAREWLDRVRS